MTDISAVQLNRFQIEAMLTSYLVDKNGKVLRRLIGFKKRALEQIKKQVLAEQ